MCVNIDCIFICALFSLRDPDSAAQRLSGSGGQWLGISFGFVRLDYLEVSVQRVNDLST